MSVNPSQTLPQCGEGSLPAAAGVVGEQKVCGMYNEEFINSVCKFPVTHNASV